MQGIPEQERHAYIFLQEDGLCIFFKFVPAIVSSYNLHQESTFSILVLSRTCAPLYLN